MLGNVSEWTADWSDAYPTGNVTDPKGGASAYNRMIRGGTSFSPAKDVRSAKRSSGAPSSNFNYVGFRLARE